MKAKKQIRIAIVAGEKSGDILASNLISELKQLYTPNQHAPSSDKNVHLNQNAHLTTTNTNGPLAQSKVEYELVFEGVAGPLMREQGIKQLYDMEELAVMGLVEVLGRLFRLLHIRKKLTQHWLDNPPDIFIGVDAPDFNLTLEQNLKRNDIKTVHYVGPSIWAWRQKRVFKVKKAVDLVLALLPFEKPFYDKYNVPCRFIGHTLADQIPMLSDKSSARKRLNLTQNAQVVAVLPGSRASEVELLAPEFAKACQLILKSRRSHDLPIVFVAASVNHKRKQQIESAFNQYAPLVALNIIDNQSRDVMTASDAIMIASGTATLEAALIKRPMVACYKFKTLSYWIFKQMVNVKYFSLPNIIADKAVIPELLQKQVQAEKIAEMIIGYLNTPQTDVMNDYQNIHQILKQNAGKQAAIAISELIHAN